MVSGNLSSIFVPEKSNDSVLHQPCKRVKNYQKACTHCRVELEDTLLREVTQAHKTSAACPQPMSQKKFYLIRNREERSPLEAAVGVREAADPRAQSMFRVEE